MKEKKMPIPYQAWIWLPITLGIVAVIYFAVNSFTSSNEWCQKHDAEINRSQADLADASCQEVLDRIEECKQYRRARFCREDYRDLVRAKCD